MIENNCEEEKSSRKKSVTLLLWLFLGIVGAHHFYNGRIGMGVLYVCTCGLCGIGCIVDLVLILIGKYRDCDGRFLS